MKKTTWKAIKNRDIETVLWDLVDECVREFNLSNNCKIGKQTFSNILSTLSQMEMLKRRRAEKEYGIKLEADAADMNDWLSVVEGGKS